MKKLDMYIYLEKLLEKNLKILYSFMIFMEVSLIFSILSEKNRGHIPTNTLGY